MSARVSAKPDSAINHQSAAVRGKKTQDLVDHDSLVHKMLNARHHATTCFQRKPRDGRPLLPRDVVHSSSVATR